MESAIIIFVSCADVAQLVEQLIRNEQVVGSNPIISSSEIKPSEVFGGLFFWLFYDFVPYLFLCYHKVLVEYILAEQLGQTFIVKLAISEF